MKIILEYDSEACEWMWNAFKYDKKKGDRR